MGGEEGRKEEEGREEIVGREEEDEGGPRSELADCCIILLTEGNMMGISCIMKRGGSCENVSRKLPCIPPIGFFYFYLFIFFFRTSQQSGRFGNLARVTLKIKYAQADQAANL